MAIVGICGITRGKHRTVTTRRDPAAPRHPDRCNRAWDTPRGPDQWWVADFTYSAQVPVMCSRRHPRRGMAYNEAGMTASGSSSGCT